MLPKHQVILASQGLGLGLRGEQGGLVEAGGLECWEGQPLVSLVSGYVQSAEMGLH